jgi:hypothetical protein
MKHACAVLSALLLVSEAAAAEPLLDVPVNGTSPDARAAAEALFEEGVRLYEAGAFAAACHKLEASESLDAAVGTLLHLADCYERLGRTASAWARFREARSLAQTQGMAARERIAAERADALEARLTRLKIDVKDPPPQLELSLSGTSIPRASWGSAIPVDPGWLLLEAVAPGYATMRHYVNVPARPGQNVTFELPPVVPEAAPLPVRTERPPSTPARWVERPARRGDDSGAATRAVGVTLGAIGVAGLATGGVLAVLAARRNHQSLEHCPEDPRRCTSRGLELRDQAGRYADYATLSAALGGVLVASGLIVYVVAPDAKGRERVSLLAAPDLGSRTVTLQARGSF